MNRRHDSLIPLTHDHHHALVQARRLQRAVGEDERNQAAREFIDFFEKETLTHFREEEELVFPLVVDEEEAALPLGRLLLDHVRIHALVGRLRNELAGEGVTEETIKVLGSTLEQHIRFEEKTLFPLVERVAADDLGHLALGPRDRTSTPDEIE